MAARQLQVEAIHITVPKLASGHVTIAQISDLYLGMMLGDKFLDRVIAKPGEFIPTSWSRPETSSTDKATTWPSLRGAATPALPRKALARAGADDCIVLLKHRPVV